MNKLFSWQTIWLTLIGTGMAGGLQALPTIASEPIPVDSINQADLIANDFRFNANSEQSDNLQKIVGLTGLGIGSAAIAYRLIKGNQRTKIDYLPSLTDLNQGNVSLIDRISPKLRRELLRLVSNPQTANRLLSGTLISHAGRSPNWAAEKVIYDLKRDRG